MIKKYLPKSPLLLSAFAFSSLDAQVVLNVPATGYYSDSGATTTELEISTATTISTPQTYLGASFDIEYTIGSTSSGANSFAYFDGTVLGVGSDGDSSLQYNTLEGDEAEGLSFTNLSINNFNAGSSGLVVSDISSQLRFTKLVLSAIANNQDGITVSYVSFADAGNSYGLDDVDGFATGGAPQDFDLTALTGYDASAASLYISNDNVASSNRWSVNGIEVAYTAAIPEPSSTALLVAFGALGFAFMRRRTA